jgi:diketogulonate reductase-like aldo/keto reductase
LALFCFTVVHLAQEDDMAERNVVFAGEVALPAIGQGTWYMGENDRQRSKEVDALRAGIDAGLRLIDTAEMYADGGAEEVVGEALQGDYATTVYLVSKVYPWNAGGKKRLRPVRPACAV